MKETPARQPADTWVVDYDAARAQAIRWLGDRYLLAHPINRPYQGARPAADTVLSRLPHVPIAQTRDATDPVDGAMMAAGHARTAA
jgi:hypothetical protein